VRFTAFDSSDTVNSATFERVSLPLENPFTISRGTQTEAENVIVRVTDEGGLTGVGGAAPSSHYGETADTVAAVLPGLLDAVERVGDPHALHEIEAELTTVVNDNPAARAAVSIAVHDLAAKRLGVPLHRLWGLDPTAAPAASYTIGLDETERVREKTHVENRADERGDESRPARSLESGREPGSKNREAEPKSENERHHLGRVDDETSLWPPEDVEEDLEREPRTALVHARAGDGVPAHGEGFMHFAAVRTRLHTLTEQLVVARMGGRQAQEQVLVGRPARRAGQECVQERIGRTPGCGRRGGRAQGRRLPVDQFLVEDGDGAGEGHQEQEQAEQQAGPFVQAVEAFVARRVHGSLRRADRRAARRRWTGP